MKDIDLTEWSPRTIHRDGYDVVINLLAGGIPSGRVLVDGKRVGTLSENISRGLSDEEAKRRALDNRRFVFVLTQGWEAGYGNSLEELLKELDTYLAPPVETREESIRQVVHNLWRQYPTGITTFGPCSTEGCDHEARGSAKCADCCTQELAGWVGVKLAVRYQECLEEKIKLEKEMYGDDNE